jgi:hypothetical protein
MILDSEIRVTESQVNQAISKIVYLMPGLDRQKLINELKTYLTICQDGDVDWLQWSGYELYRNMRFMLYGDE